MTAVTLSSEVCASCDVIVKGGTLSLSSIKMEKRHRAEASFKRRSGGVGKSRENPFFQTYRYLVPCYTCTCTAKNHTNRGGVWFG